VCGPLCGHGIGGGGVCARVLCQAGASEQAGRKHVEDGVLSACERVYATLVQGIAHLDFSRTYLGTTGVLRAM